MNPFLTISRTPDDHMETLVDLVFDDPFTFGMAFVDAARVIAQAYADQEGGMQQHYLERIKEGFDLEWGEPTTDVTMKPVKVD